MDHSHAPDTSTYGAFFAILIIIVIVIVIAKVSLESFTDTVNHDHRIIVEEHTPVEEGMSGSDARRFIERILNTTETDNTALQKLITQLP